MKLKYAKIINFRSIKEVKIDFEPSCRILVGINESGKSNILKALSMIGAEFSPTAEDIREPLPKEKPISESYIWFVFGLEKQEVEKIYSLIKPKVLAKKVETPLLKTTKGELTLRDFCGIRNEGLYKVDTLKQKKDALYWALSDGYEILKHWKKPSDSCPADYQIQAGDTSVTLKNYELVNVQDYADIPETHLIEATPEDINELVGGEIAKLIPGSLPRVIFWKYDEANLLPPSVNIDAFAMNPDSCIPLKNMFTLAGIKDIAGEINKARATTNKLRNLLKRVAAHSTNHFRNVWKEYKEISFALEPNGSTIEPNIVEKNHWRMSQRSDGVKRFITFLLHISANVKANVLSGSLLLIDEPDMSLHPSGARFLRDELIETSKKNLVVFSTHSIFMIDKEKINRHIIVKKEHEITSTKNANESNFVDEEVLYNALNYTVFDVLKKDNIIFEGWRDKQLFQTALRTIPATYAQDLKGLKERMKDIGLCHAEGVKDVKNITPPLELANRRCLILSDSDIPAREKQKQHKEARGYGNWKRYDEILKNPKVETAEDFLKIDFFKKQVDEILKNNHSTASGNPSIPATERMTAIKQWLSQQGAKPDEIKKSLNELKDLLFGNLKASDIDNSYYEFLKNLSPLVNATLPIAVISNKKMRSSV